MPNAQAVDVMKRKQDDRVYYRNLCTCKLVWLCPVCAARISERRTAELVKLFSRTYDKPSIDADGFSVTRREPRYHVAMLTFTVGHKLKFPLSKSMSQLKSAYHGLWSGRRAQSFNRAFGILGSVRAFEITYGEANGWHPHIHTLIVSEQSFTIARRSEINAVIAQRWFDEVDRAQGYVTLESGLTISVGADSLVKYIDKAGQHIARVNIDPKPIHEVTKTPAKKGHDKGRTLWQLLADYVRGDIVAGSLWATAQGQLAGTRQLLPSNSIKALLDDPMSLDDEVAGIVTVEPDDICLAQLSLDEWRLVYRWGLRGQLLEVARAKGAEGVWDFLNRLRAMSRNSTRIPS